MFALENQKPPLNPKSSQVSKPRFLTLEADIQHIIAYESRSRRTGLFQPTVNQLPERPLSQSKADTLHCAPIYFPPTNPTHSTHPSPVQ